MVLQLLADSREQVVMVWSYCLAETRLPKMDENIVVDVLGSYDVCTTLLFHAVE